MKYILTDIEGTTTSINFVHDELFPYARREIENYILRNSETSEVQNCLKLTQETAFAEFNKSFNQAQCIELLIRWIDEDRKHPALKTLQGFIWEIGYKKGEIAGHLYDDVVPQFEKWKLAGLEIGVYSSGSIKAQHLLFEFSNKGNITSFFSHYFDTSIGHKRETQSYINIQKKIGMPYNQITFLSDIKEELDAAKLAGMNTVQLIRTNQVIVGSHQQVKSFSELDF